ncbi:MAG: hypothetical protein HRT92_03445 [Piscirickettsiaceae bacterium]|nr:hypothetical protein [Piscirickettsiaceae bacterium]
MFSGENFDFVITVCGNVAQEICPCFAGKPKHIHWGEPDPAAVIGSDEDKHHAFSDCFKVFYSRIKRLLRGLNKKQHQTDSNEIMQLMLDLANS